VTSSEGTKPGVLERVRRKAGRINRELFWERDHDAAKSALVLGSGRSGTTWLAEVIARQCGSRVLFEPFHPRLGNFNRGLKLFMAPGEGDPEATRPVERVLAGRVRHRQIDHIQSPRLPGGRVIKDIHATNLAPWFRERHPEMPLIYLVRHPLAASASRMRAGTFNGLGAYLDTDEGRGAAERSPAAQWLPMYDEHSEDHDRLVRLVAEWCIENAYPLSCAEERTIEVVHYETAVLDPVNEVTRLVELNRGALGGQAGEDMTIGALRQPSAMDWFGTAGAERDWNSILARWTTEVPAATVDRCLHVVSDFGIDVPYGDGPLPQKKTWAK
jgi:hypothetical protein